MNHEAYIRQVPNSKNAVLMIHGIAGSPAHFRDLVCVIPQDWSVYNILLDGHGKKAEDFGATSMKRWQAQVHHRLRSILDNHEQVVIVAHSMGTLFAIEEAIADSRQIAGLFLLNVPLQVHLPLQTLTGGLYVALGKTQAHPVAQAMVADTSIAVDGRLYAYLRWPARLIELLQLIAKVRKDVSRLAVPTQAFQSQKDELVSEGAQKRLADNAYIQVTVLQESGHFSYSPADTLLLQNRLIRLLNQSKI